MYMAKYCSKCNKKLGLFEKLNDGGIWVSLPIRLYSCVYKMLGLDKKINMIIL